jgi:hypothetical protein
MMPPLLNLPNELLLDIGRNLKRSRDISAFCKANRRLNNLLVGYLYRRDIECGEYAALFWAARKGQEGVARMSLDAGADVNIIHIGEFHSTTLAIAIYAGNLAVVKLLFEKGGVVGGRFLGKIPLSLAARFGHAAIIEFFLDQGADPNTKDTYDATPLALAAARGQRRRHGGPVQTTHATRTGSREGAYSSSKGPR